MRRRGFLWAFFLVAVAAGWLLIQPTAVAHRDFEIRVTVTNITRGQVLSPPVVATHRGSREPVEHGSRESGDGIIPATAFLSIDDVPALPANARPGVVSQLR